MTLFRRRRKDSEIDEELRSHLNLAIETRIDRKARAAFRSLIQFGHASPTTNTKKSGKSTDAAS